MDGPRWFRSVALFQSWSLCPNWPTQGKAPMNRDDDDVVVVDDDDDDVVMML